jgi:hypothetical protein
MSFGRRRTPASPPCLAASLEMDNVMQGVGSPPSNTRRPLTAEPRRSEDGLWNPNSSSPKGWDADAETRPQAQRKGMCSILASSLCRALTRTKTSKTGSPETRSKGVSPETRSARLPERVSSALSDEDEHMVPPTEHHVGSAKVNLLPALEKLWTLHYLRGAKWTHRVPHDAKSWSKMVNALQHRVPRNTYTCILQPLHRMGTDGRCGCGYRLSPPEGIEKHIRNTLIYSCSNKQQLATDLFTKRWKRGLGFRGEGFARQGGSAV